MALAAIFQTALLRHCRQLKALCLCSAHAKLPLNEDLEMTFLDGDTFKPNFTSFLCEGIEHHANESLLTSGVHARLLLSHVGTCCPDVQKLHDHLFPHGRIRCLG